MSWSRQKNGTEPDGENVLPKAALKTLVCVEAGEETDEQVLVNGCLRNRMTFGGQFLRQLAHRLQCFKAAFAETFSPPGSVPSSYHDQLSFGG